jgi:molecular chaperone DnaJ
MTAGFDPYAVLGVSRDATGAQIVQARHQLVRRYHPDLNPAPDAAARFDEVQQAFHLLSNPADRARWDREHAKPVPAGSQPGGTAGRFTVFPTSVDFGVVVRGNPGVWKDVRLAAGAW